MNSWGNAVFYQTDIRNISCYQWVKLNHVLIHKFRQLMCWNHWFEYWKINFCLISDLSIFQSCSGIESLSVTAIIAITDVISIIMIYWNQILTCKLSTWNILYLSQIVFKKSFLLSKTNLYPSFNLSLKTK